MIGMAFMSWRFEWLVAALPGMEALTKRVRQNMNRLLRNPGQGGHFTLGILNGFLPCGMVYAALAGAISTADVLSGTLFMVVFGAGTLPLLLGVHFLSGRFGTVLRQHVRFVQPVLLLVAGIWLINRGLHLDLSLFESAVPKAGKDCH
jgi:sulfite exporter TauE/SafE